MIRNAFVAITLAAISAQTACGPGRTAAATQPTPVAFDPAASDPKAVAIVDAMVVALGGAEAWAAVKQIRWESKYTLDGEIKSWVKHAWDMWNGRHRCEVADMATIPKAGGAPIKGGPQFTLAMYDLIDLKKAGYASKGKNQLSSSQRDSVKKNCFQRWQQHSYQLAMPFKLKDPGVKLESVGQIKDVATKVGHPVCSGGCDSIKVTFVESVGQDTWWLHINAATHMPEVVEQKAGDGRRAYVFGDWQEVNGLKFPGKLQNAGIPGEVFHNLNIVIGSPDDRLYIPAVR